MFNDCGTLNVGAPADVAILELREGTFDFFLDNYKNTITDASGSSGPALCSRATD